MTTTECKYAQIDKEALSIIVRVKKFHNFLYERKFEIRTDHKPLLGLFTANQVANISLPWMLCRSIMLSGYEFELCYRLGPSIANANDLSRLPRPTPESKVLTPMEVVVLEALDAPPYTELTGADPVPSRGCTWVLKGWSSGNQEEEYVLFVRRQHKFTVHRGCLWWSTCVVIPPERQGFILQTLHASHQGIV
ncbi:hypothetical protein PR048_016524 [Dryococelus australis]|uniref:Reverse transcriptase RNase H-like domain-containing protein n=1 Tax=Dryococelus australis TaxID=614101 RepID=A0ABQ9HJZ3_9NEOP|nr:hypothetical protein PR048_016524 [Dryococelus australis]